LRQFFSQFKKSAESKPTELLSPPLDLSYEETIFRTKRGFLARKIGQYLGLDQAEQDQMFNRSLTQSSFLQDTDDEQKKECILSLSDQMLEWNEQQEDMAGKVKSFKLPTNLQNAMLKAYEIHKDDLFTPLFKPKEPVVECEKHQEWKIYRDVLLAATQGQFLLISREEAENYRDGKVLCEGVIMESSDIPICRDAARKCFDKMDIHKGKIMGWLLVLSEAITNTIKHAEEGKMTVLENTQTNEVTFVIEDKGPGFALDDLPNKILRSGYSTKKSLGQGFTLMMKMAKKLALFTSPKGSTLILIFEASDEKEGRKNAVG
jgi:anti-sigma regulatory factor (Ser/Thr protein kinase)